MLNIHFASTVLIHQIKAPLVIVCWHLLADTALCECVLLIAYTAFVVATAHFHTMHEYCVLWSIGQFTVVEDALMCAMGQTKY